MRFTSAILGAAVTIGSSDALFGLHRRTPTQINVNCGSGDCTGAQSCNQSLRSGCPAPMMQQSPCSTPNCMSAPMMQQSSCSTPNCMSAPMMSAPMMPAPMMPLPMIQPCSSAPNCQAPQQSCGPTCPPKQVVVQEVHRRPVTVNRVEYKPVYTQHTIQEEFRVNKLVNIPQQPVCQAVCPSTIPSCVPCGAAGPFNSAPLAFNGVNGVSGVNGVNGVNGFNEPIIPSSPASAPLAITSV